MKRIFLFISITLFISCRSTSPIVAQSSSIGSYTLVVEGYDWGPGASKVILTLDEVISKVQKEDFFISASKQAECNGFKTDIQSGERTILYAYVSDDVGNKRAEGSHITLVLLVAPNLDISSPMQYIPQCGGNVWANYTLSIKSNASQKVWEKEIGRIHPLVDQFDLSGKFVYNSAITLTYADFTPTVEQEKIPLIIWLHGGGEGGTDTTIPLMANRAANYASPEIQDYFGGAYVLVPQSPTFWMDKGTGEYTRGEVNDMYNESLMALIKDYVAQHPKVDTDRIYVGGCSNGGLHESKVNAPSS